MNTQDKPEVDFEQRLLAQLRAVVAERAVAEAALEVAGSAAMTPAWRRPRPRLALAGAGALAGVLAGILVIGSGPTAQPAAAEILHQTAAVAAASAAPAEIPGPGQFLYTKFKRLELEGWIAGGPSPGDSSPGQLQGGMLSRPDAFNALMPTTQESWLAADGAGRRREVAGTPRFLTPEEQSRWEAAGSPLPAPFDPEYQRKYPLAFGAALKADRSVVDTEHAKLKGFHLPDTSRLPTEPKALRLAVESNQISVGGFNLMEPAAKQLDTEETTAELFNILQEGNPMTPQLRAAVFNALAELPGIEVDTDATDFLGRPGYAIRSIDPQTGGGSEYLFDPETSEMLAERSFIGDARLEARQNPSLQGLPSGLTVRETAYLATGVVDSTDESGAGK